MLVTGSTISAWPSDPDAGKTPAGQRGIVMMRLPALSGSDTPAVQVAVEPGPMTVMGWSVDDARKTPVE